MAIGCSAGREGVVVGVVVVITLVGEDEHPTTNRRATASLSVVVVNARS
jgi:hypothetical protein